MEYKRECPNCRKTITGTNKEYLKQAEKLGCFCRECSGKRQSERIKGEGNPFYGKKHPRN